jgi:hypothetical protein
MRPTLQEIEAAKTPAGGWTREQLAQWGVPWPPPKGWKKRLLREASIVGQAETDPPTVTKSEREGWDVIKALVALVERGVATITRRSA